MIRHSVIIPNRDYERWLRHCLWSLRRSARLSDLEVAGFDATDLEVVVVSESDPRMPGLGGMIPEIGVNHAVPRQGRYFNKPRLLNIGIERSHGQILTFLDADSIVGSRFLETALLLLEPQYGQITKFCYRVRYLPELALQLLKDAPSETVKETLLQGWFSMWLSYDRAFEGYGQPEINVPDKRIDPQVPVFGNSAFSIRRDVLGDLRFDEQYVGRGYEDVEMNRRIWRQYGERYKALIMTDTDHGIFQIRNPYQGELWGPGEQNSLNQERYART